MFHDIGKAKIPLAVLDKPGRLDAEERALIETHPALAVVVTTTRFRVRPDSEPGPQSSVTGAATGLPKNESLSVRVTVASALRSQTKVIDVLGVAADAVPPANGTPTSIVAATMPKRTRFMK